MYYKVYEINLLFSEKQIKTFPKITQKYRIPKKYIYPFHPEGEP